jgi:acyl carrier protein
MMICASASCLQDSLSLSSSASSQGGEQHDAGQQESGRVGRLREAKRRPWARERGVSEWDCPSLPQPPTDEEIDMDELLVLIRKTLQIDTPIDKDTPLLSSGLIDSFALVTLLAAVEEQYAVSLDEAELTAEAFDTPEQMFAHIRQASEGR